jgi:hypothetical protein
MAGIDQLQLGKFLQIAFSEGIRSQLSDDYRDWEMIKRKRQADPNGRELRFLLQSSYGPGAVQWRNPTSSGSFPAGQQSAASEHTATYKEIDTTVEVEYNLWKRLQKSPAKYADNLAIEMNSKMIASKREVAKQLYGDGTGVICTSSGAGTISAGRVTVVVDASSAARGHTGLCEYGDLLFPRNPDGTSSAPTVSSGTFYAYRIVSRSRKTDTIVLAAIDAANAELTVTATNLASGDVFFRVGQPTGGESALDLTQPGLANGTIDYGTLTEVMPGLESLAAADGRLCWGVKSEGATAATVEDAAGDPLDVSHIEEVMNNVKVNVGEASYNWKMMSMAPEAHSSFVEGRETDRRFTTVEDSKRGLKAFAYIHRNSVLEAVASEYIKKKRIYFLPEDKAGNKVIEAYMTDFEPVTMKGMGEFHLKPNTSGGHQRKVATYMNALITLVCKHPAAIGRLDNFSI